MKESNDILFLGPEGCGKTLLMRRIKEVIKSKLSKLLEKDSIFSPESTIPTIGVDLITVDVSEVFSMNLREVGAAMVSRWESYIPSCSCLVFIIDASDVGSIASCYTLLMEILSNYQKPIILTINKIDISEPSNLYFIENILRINEIKRKFFNIYLLRGSALDGTLATVLLEWIIAYFKLSY